MSENEAELLEAQAEKLAELADLPKEDVLAELQRIMTQEGFTAKGAVVVWKARNSFQLGRGSVELEGRVLAKEGERTTPPGADGRTNRVATIHFAVEDPDSGDIVFKAAPLWNERIDRLWETFKLDHAYRFKATVRNDGNLTRIRNIEELEDCRVPVITQIKPTPLDAVANQGGQYDLVRGTIGRLITSRVSSEIIGADIADLESIYPLTVWFGGRFNPLSEEEYQVVQGLKVGDEVVVYGFVNLAGTDVSIRSSRVVVLE